MTRAVDDLVLAAILVCVGLGSCLGIEDCGDRAQAQDPPPASIAPTSESDETTLARALVAEADGHRADYRPILSVFQTRADRVGSSPARVARRYASIYRIPLRLMLPRALEVSRMPTAIPPGERATQWERAMTITRAWLAGDHATACRSTPSHFGDRHGDARRARARGWLVVDCGDTANAFFRER